MLFKTMVALPTCRVCCSAMMQALLLLDDWPACGILSHKVELPALLPLLRLFASETQGGSLYSKTGNYPHATSCIHCIYHTQQVQRSTHHRVESYATRSNGVKE